MSSPKAEPERPAIRARRGRGICGRARRRRGSTTAPPTSTRTAPTARTRTAPAPKRTSLAKPIAARKPSRSNPNAPTASTRRRKRAPSGVRANPVRTTAASVSVPSPMFFPLPGRTALIRRGLSPSSLGRSRADPRDQSNECPPCARQSAKGVAPTSHSLAQARFTSGRERTAFRPGHVGSKRRPSGARCGARHGDALGFGIRRYPRGGRRPFGRSTDPSSTCDRQRRSRGARLGSGST